MDLNELVVFAKVVEAESFIRASRELRMPKSTVSRKVADLEERLGARLLQRTTRRLSLTDVGRAYYQHAARVVAEAAEAEAVVTRMQAAPQGLLRVTTPLNVEYLAPIVASFLLRYPDVQIDVVGTDRRVDLVQEGFDVAIRAGSLSDSTLVARSLGTVRSYVVASPAFLDRQGTPRKPEDLAKFDCLVFGAGADRTHWKLFRDGRTLTVTVRARLVVNDFEFLDEAAREGVGIAMIPVHRASPDLRAGRLRHVLTEWCSPGFELHAVYPSTRHLSPKVKAFLDHVSEQMVPPPWERAGEAEGSH